MPALRRMSDKRYHTRLVLTVDEHNFRTEFARHDATTDEQVGDLLHINARTIRRIRSGETQPSNGFLAACMDAGINYAAFLVTKRADELAAA